MMNVIMLSVSMINVVMLCAECRYDECNGVMLSVIMMNAVHRILLRCVS
jgi:hypothetical protein